MKAKQIYAFIARDIKIIFTDKIALFWLLLWPLIWLFMVAYVFIPPGAVSPVQLDVGVVNHDMHINTTNMNFTSQDFINMLSNTTYEGKRIFNVKVYDNNTALIRELRRGGLDAGIIIPANFSLNLTIGTARLRVLIGARDLYSSSINYGVINGFLNEFSRRVGIVKAEITLKYVKMSTKYLNQSNTTIPQGSLSFIRRYIIGIATPLNTSYENVKPEALANRPNILGWYTIGAIGMMFLYTGLSQGAAAIYREKSAGTLRRILASPITPGILVWALTISNMVILTISAAILLLVGVHGVGAHVLFNPLNPVYWLVPVLLFIAAYMSLGIGLILSLFAKTMHGANSLGIALGLLLAFTTGIWFPKTLSPQWMQLLAEYFPVTWVIDTLRNIMVYNLDISHLWLDIAKIIIALLTIMLIDAIIYKARLKKYIVSY